MADVDLQDCIEDINNGVTQSSASDATLEGYTLMLVNGNGELVDKQPVSRIEQLIYNYLTTTRGSALAGVIKNLLPALLSDQGTSGTKFPSLNSSNVLGSMTAANLASVLGVFKYNIYEIRNGQEYTINRGYCLIKIATSAGGFGALLSFDNTMTIIYQTYQNLFSTEKDTNDKINIFRVSEYSFAIQNNSGSNKPLRCLILNAYD